MTIYGAIIPGARSIARWGSIIESLTEEAKHRIKILDWHRSHRNNVSLTARHFGLSRYTVREWQKRFSKYGMSGLNEKSRKPKTLRRPNTPWTMIARIVQLRREYPAWSKHKLAAILKREGMQTSSSTVGRILKRKGLIDKRISKKRRKSALRPKARFPKGLRIYQEGQLIQMDTKYIMLPGGKRFYQFTAIDVLGKRKVLRVYPSESSRNGAMFLQECIASFPFKVQAVQTDNGAPFLKEFDKLCKEKGIPHYFIYPRQPKQNTYVEISHEADEREFYRQGNVYSILSVMQVKIKGWEDIWNNFRPHESLGQLTPSEYSQKIKIQGLPTKNVIILQT